MALPSFDRLEIEGIPTYAARSATRYTGAIVFRVGRADETLRHGGLSHLVEHLALFGLGLRQDYLFNGYNAGLFTGFIATGTPEEVGEFMNAVARGLENLPVQRVADEARVLRTEAAGRNPGPSAEFLWFRYGSTGHGQILMPELGLADPEPDRVKAWARERFTADNAALWFSGPPPANLRLDLPRGRRFAPPKPVCVPGVNYPAWATGSPGGVGFSTVRPREEWLSATLSIAVERISTHLRYDRALTYDVGQDYEPVTTDTMHAAIWAGCLPDHAAAVRDGILDTIRELGTSGPTEEELQRSRQGYVRSREDPDAAMQEVANAAMNDLVGYRVRTAGEVLREIEELGAAEIARRVTAALESALVVLPPGCAPPENGFEAYPSRSPTTVRGRSYRHVGSTFPWSKGPRLLVGDQGVSLVHQGGVLTVEYASCAAVVSHPNQAVELFGEDGFRLLVDPAQWRQGPDAVSRVLQDAPADRVVSVAPLDKPS